MLNVQLFSDSLSTDLSTMDYFLSMEFSRQEFWSRSPFPTAGELPDPGMEIMSLAFPAVAADSLPLVPPGKHLDL